MVAVTKAERLPKSHRLVQLTEEVSRKARMRAPRVYLVPEGAVNAFATGVRLPIPLIGGRGAIGFTQGIEDQMEDEALKGVIGHELTHLKSGDLILATMASALIISVSLILRIIVRWPRLLGGVRIGSGKSSSSGSKKSGKGTGCGAALLAALKVILAAIVLFAIVVAVFIITQIVMPLIRGWINRHREFWADAGSAAILGSPDPLIGALRQLRYAQTTVGGVGHFAGMFFNVPAFEVEDAVDRLFATHPGTDARIAALERRADGKLNI